MRNNIALSLIFLFPISLHADALGDALDTVGVVWSTEVSPWTWTSQSAVKYYGPTAAKSAVINWGNSSQIWTTIQGPKTLSFYWKVNCTPGYDDVEYLGFFDNGNRIYRIFGAVDWQQKTYSVPSGTHILKWEYFKQTHAIGESEGAWLDYVTGINQHPPTLGWTGETNYIATGVSPETGDKNTNFIYRVKYFDQDGDASASGYPQVHIVKGGSEISGSPFTMSYVSGANSTGAIYSLSKTLANGMDYSYYFGAQDILGGIASNFPSVAKTGPAVYKALINWTGEAGYAADGLSPESGDRNASYIYRLKFSDSDNAAPAAGYPKLHIKQGGAEITGSPFTMSYVSGAYTSGAIYSYTETLLPGTNYTYYFEAQDATSANAGGSPTTEINAPDVSNQFPNLAWTGETNYLNDGVYPKAASSDVLSVFRVKYSDADNDALTAGYPKLYIKKGYAQISGSPFLMNCTGTGYVAGIICDYSKVLGTGEYSYWFEAFDIYNGLASGAPASENGGLVSIGTGLPAAQDVKVYHNVFKPGENEKTNVSFNTTTPVTITITVYNNVGRQVKELYRGTSSSGLNLIQWDGHNDSGQRVSSGVYTIKIAGGGINQTKRVVVVR